MEYLNKVPTYPCYSPFIVCKIFNLQFCTTLTMQEIGCQENDCYKSHFWTIFFFPSSLKKTLLLPHLCSVEKRKPKKGKLLPCHQVVCACVWVNINIYIYMYIKREREIMRKRYVIVIYQNLKHDLICGHYNQPQHHYVKQIILCFYTQVLISLNIKDKIKMHAMQDFWS